MFFAFLIMIMVNEQQRFWISLVSGVLLEGVLGRLGGLLGASWSGLEDLRGVLGASWGVRAKTNDKQKTLKNHWFYSISELPGHTKSVCEAVNVA